MLHRAIELLRATRKRQSRSNASPRGHNQLARNGPPASLHLDRAATPHTKQHARADALTVAPLFANARASSSTLSENKRAIPHATTCTGLARISMLAMSSCRPILSKTSFHPPDADQHASTAATLHSFISRSILARLEEQHNVKRKNTERSRTNAAAMCEVGDASQSQAKQRFCPCGGNDKNPFDHVYGQASKPTDLLSLESMRRALEIA